MRLRDPPCRARGQHRASPHDRGGVGEGDRDHLGRVDREVAVRRATRPRPRRGQLATCSTSVRGPRSTLVEVVQHHHGRRELVAGHGRQHRRPPADGVVGDQRPGRAGHHELAAAPHGLGHRGRGPGVGTDGREHDDQVHAAGPAGQRRARPRHEGHRAPGLQDGSEQPGVRAGRQHRAGTDALAAAGDGLGHGLGGVAGLAAYPRAGLGQAPQHLVGARQRALVVEPRLVEPRRHRLSPACAPRRPAGPGCRRGPGRPGRSPVQASSSSSGRSSARHAGQRMTSRRRGSMFMSRS